VKSTFCWSLLFFLLFNLFLNKEDEKKGVVAATLRARLFDYAGIERDPGYLEHTPNIILAGSSLLLRPEWSVDRTLHLHEPWGKRTIISASDYHLAQGLDNQLASSGFEDPHVYDLAAGGALISDAYLLFYHYLKSHPKPSVVVLDCAPRSFNDSGVTRPDCTDIFDCCFRLQDLPELRRFYLNGFDATANYLCSRLYFMYHHRQWLVSEAKERISSSISTVSRFIHSDLSTTQRACNTSSSATISKSAAKTKQDNLCEYQFRYSQTNRLLLAPQLKFLRLFANLCDAKQIKLIVVNMPLTRENRDLLPSGFYSDFTKDVATAIGPRATFINLAHAEWSSDCYDDSVHLNAKGGMKLNHLLADAIVNVCLERDLATGEQ
jgi:hypothetical protein